MRDASGRFAHGNPGGPGRPRRQTEEQYLRALTDCVPEAIWRQIVAKAVDQALAGDLSARAWLAKYLLPDRSEDELFVPPEPPPAPNEPDFSKLSLDELKTLEALMEKAASDAAPNRPLTTIELSQLLGQVGPGEGEGAAATQPEHD